MEEKKQEAERTGDREPAGEEKRDFKGYAMKRIAVGVLLTFAALWVFGTVLGLFDRPSEVSHSVDSGKPVAADHGTRSAEGEAERATVGTAADQRPTPADHAKPSAHTETRTANHGKPAAHEPAAAKTSEPSVASAARESHSSDSHGKTTPPDAHRTAAPPDAHGTEAAADSHGTAPGGDHGVRAAPATRPGPKGIAFINATIEPMEHELGERFWGWRPNDILDFTDNVNNFQLGVLEVTRRTAVTLSERISRTGSTAAFDKNLETAMNWFMIKADRYWFPSPESKYKAGLSELKKYKERLLKGSAKFYTRTDNLIPLLMQFEDLLGSCDDNLVKHQEADGSTVSHFKSDDYFFYAKGVASALYTILQAIHQDFHTVIESRRGTEVLHHAIESCRHAMELKPLYITNSSLSGILANHRANMAAPISHARFYLGVLIKTLST